MDRESPQLTMKMIECGNLALDRPIEHGILLFGDTKAGKTTCGHYFVGTILRAIPDKMTGAKYQVQTCLRQHANYKIGLENSVSQTQIPNEFSLANFQGMTQKDIILFDCPGYSDSFGCSRIISNGYFHYRLFSKVKKIKFVLTFSFDDMKGKAEALTKTFFNFINGFSDSAFDSLSTSIFAATSIMITKVPNNFDREGVIEAFANAPFAKRSPIHKRYFQQLKKQVLINERVFYLQSAQLGKVPNHQNTDIVDIDKRSSFWQRKITDDEPEMSMIKTSIEKSLYKSFQDEPLNKEEFQIFGKCYEKNFSKRLEVLQEIFTQFILDTFNLESVGRQEYLKKIQKTIQQQEREIEKLREQRIKVKGETKQNPIYEMHRLYKDKKINVMDSIYKSSLESSLSSSRRNSPVWLKRVRVAEVLGKFCNKFGVEGVDREVQTILEMSGLIDNAIRQMISLNKNSPSIEYMKKFGYEIHQNLEVSNVFYKIMYNPQNAKNAVSDTSNPLSIILIKYPGRLTDIAFKTFEKNIKEHKLELSDQLMKKKNLIEGEREEQGKEVIEYFKELGHILPENGDEVDEVTYKRMEGIEQKANEIILNQCEQVLKKINTARPDQNSLVKNIKDLNEMRLSIEDKLIKERKSAFENQNLIFQSIRMLDLMAESFVLLEDIDTAIRIWELVLDGHKIFKAMEETEQKKMPLFKKDFKEHYAFLLKYMHLSRRLYRLDISMKKAQEALSIAYKLCELSKVNEVRAFMTTLMHIENDNVMANEENYQKFAEWIKTGLFDMKISQDIAAAINKRLRTE